MAFWNLECATLSNKLWKPGIKPKTTQDVNTNSWFKQKHLTFPCDNPTTYFGTNNTEKTYTYSRKIRILPNFEQKHQLTSWWHAYRYTYNKTIEGMIDETKSNSSPNFHVGVKDDKVVVEYGQRSELTPHINLWIKEVEPKISCKFTCLKKRVKVTIKVLQEEGLKVKFYQEYPKVSKWEHFRDIFVSQKDRKTKEIRPFFQDDKNSWLLSTYKTIRADACKEACKNYKTMCTNRQRYFKVGTVASLGFKSKRTESWTIGMEKCNITLFEKRIKRKKHKKKAKKKNNNIKKHFVNVCDIKTPMRCKEWFKEGFGDPKLHKDKFGDFWLVLPYKTNLIEPKEEKPCCALDQGIKTFSTSYNTKGDIYRYCTENTKLTSLINSKDTIKNRKRIQNIVNDMHCKVVNHLVNNNNVVVIGKFNVKSILESGTITKAAKRKLQALSHYKFKERLKFKGLSKSVSIVEHTESGTTKTCPCCGHWNKNIQLGDDVFECPNCSFTSNRDDKAACCIYIRYAAKV